MLKLLNRLALIGAAGAVAATSLVGLAAPAQADVYNVSLSASATSVPVGSTVTLTAYTSTDVGPTPYYIEIFDQSALPTPKLLVSCGSGTSCSVSVSQNAPGSHTYIAFVSSSSSSYPPPNIQSTSNTVTVTWTPPSAGGPAGNSTLCDGGKQVFDQNTEGVRSKLYTLSPSPTELDVCVRVEQNGIGLGGMFVIQEPSPSVGLTGLGAPTTDSNFTACQTTPGNTVPGAHPIEQGTVAGISVLFDAYASASTAWVCLWVPAAQTRLVVPIPQASVTIGPLPSVSFLPDPGTP
jgi:hypothetical protein